MGNDERPAEAASVEMLDFRMISGEEPNTVRFLIYLRIGASKPFWYQLAPIENQPDDPKPVVDQPLGLIQ